MPLLNGGGVGGVGPQKFDTDIGEVKSLIQDVDSDVAVVDGKIDGLQTDVDGLGTSVGSVQTSVGNMQNTVNSMSGTVNSINTNVNTLLNGRVVKSVQRGATAVNSASIGSGHLVNIPIIQVDSSRCLVNASFVGSSSSNLNITMLVPSVSLSDNQLTLSTQNLIGVHGPAWMGTFIWQVVEFY